MILCGSGGRGGRAGKALSGWSAPDRRGPGAATLEGSAAARVKPAVATMARNAWSCIVFEVNLVFDTPEQVTKLLWFERAKYQW